MLGQIFAGGLETLREAGVALLGGHTVQDQEIKFGYAVTGDVHPARFWANGGAQPGDVLFLTKPLGTGDHRHRAEVRSRARARADAAVRSMLIAQSGRLRRAPGAAGRAVHACTDVTGFGLVGHASEMAAASGCRLAIDAGAVPLLDGRADARRRQRAGRRRDQSPSTLPAGTRDCAATVSPRSGDSCSTIRRRPAGCWPPLLRSTSRRPAPPLPPPA